MCTVHGVNVTIVVEHPYCTDDIPQCTQISPQCTLPLPTNVLTVYPQYTDIPQNALHTPKCTPPPPPPYTACTHVM